MHRGRSGAGRRAVGRARAAGRLRRPRILAATVGRAGIDHRPDDGRRAGPDRRRRPGPLRRPGGRPRAAGRWNLPGRRMPGWGSWPTCCPRPVLVGYMAGIAFVMIGSQLGKLTGVKISGDEFIDQLRSFIAGISTSALADGRVGGVGAGVVVRLGPVAPRAPVAPDRCPRGDRRGGGVLVGRPRHRGRRRDPGRAARARRCPKSPCTTSRRCCCRRWGSPSSRSPTTC